MSYSNTRALTGLLVGAGLGAGCMYLLDPSDGKQRRAVIRGKLAVAGLRTADEALADRVRAKLGRYVANPSAIEVDVRGGCVALYGQILHSEVDEALAAVKKVRGVCVVDCVLEVFETPGSPFLEASFVQS